MHFSKHSRLKKKISIYYKNIKPRWIMKNRVTVAIKTKMMRILMY